MTWTRRRSRRGWRARAGPIGSEADLWVRAAPARVDQGVGGMPTSWACHPGSSDTRRNRGKVRRSQPRLDTTLRNRYTNVLLQGDGDRLELGVVFQRRFAELAADSAGLVAAEGSRGVEDVVAVDPDGAGAEAFGDRVGLLDVARPDG